MDRTPDHAPRPGSPAEPAPDAPARREPAAAETAADSVVALAAARAPAPPVAADPAAMRERYRAEGLDREGLPGHPMEQFARWFEQAAQAAVRGQLHEANAMVVSTADTAGRPSSRTVLMKGYDRAGFVFYTNYDSRKGRELAANPNVALLFPWHPLARQVVVTGTARRTGRDETAAYFHSRPYGSQLGAWASDQSSVVASREQLDAAYEKLGERYPEGTEVPVPPHWGGFQVVPDSVEFWQGRDNRLHDRLRYTARPDGTWQVERLSP